MGSLSENSRWKTSQKLVLAACENGGGFAQDRQSVPFDFSHSQPEIWSHPHSQSTHPENFSGNPDFERKIASLIHVYSGEVCEQTVEETSEHYTVYRDWLIGCLRFHAEQFQTGQTSRRIDELIRCLQEGRSPDNEATGNEAALGGNPLRDGMLAVALLVKEPKAIAVFENDYYDYLKGVA